jgi:CheY-like chemotaxis protein
MGPQGLRVYLVEDSRHVRDLLQEAVESAGATVVGHADAAPDAVQDIAALRPDAVIIDIALRIGSGFDVLEAMAINDDLACPLPIVLTNHAYPVYREAALNLGAKYFFDKSKDIERAVEALTRPNGPRRAA